MEQPPPQYQEHHSDASPTEPSQLSAGSRVTALYDYAANSPDELSFEYDDELELLEQPNDIDAGWLKGKLISTGEVGIFPANYVEKSVL